MTDYRFLLKKRSKKRNFSEREVAILTEEYKKHMLILNSRLTNSITNQKKQRIWERITESINAVGVNRRRVSEVKEKWRNMQRKARRIIAERNLSLDSLEDQVPSSNSGSNSRVRMVEKPLVDTVETLATVAASSSTSSMVDDNHGVAISSENGSVQVGSNHRTDDKPSINSSLHVNNDSNGADVDNHLTIGKYVFFWGGGLPKVVRFNYSRMECSLFLFIFPFFIFLFIVPYGLTIVIFFF